jgi:crotonobetainyl-CoA:carnitine CoA-transferase CaiB-like acyl-CoA transferase
MPGPLAGIRIVDLTAMASGPFATALLGDQGADVIKIEPPGSGDLIRHIGSSRNGMSAVFANLNRSKRSVVLNLREKRGIELLELLAATADVFVQNFRPGVVDRMGIGADRLRASNPGLLYVSISGFGEQGPDRGRRVYDSVMQAYSGFVAHQANPETGEPAFVHNVVCDKSTALTTAQAITAALFARERGAGGQHLKLSMLHASIAFLWPDGMQNYTFLGQETDGEATGEETTGPDTPGPKTSSSERTAGGPMRRATLPAIRETLDGHLAITTVGDDEFRGLCRALGLAELQHDERFAASGARARNGDALHEIVAPIVHSLTTAELSERLAAEDVPHASVTELPSLHEHPQVVANELLQEDDHPITGPMRSPRPVAEFEHTPSHVERLAPALGEHTAEVLAEIGVSPAEVEELRARGVVA